MSDLLEFLHAFDAIPYGCHRATYRNRSYHVRKSSLVSGKAEKLQAEELGGPDYISLNLYRLSSEALLKPCEMPTEKVIDFVVGCRLVGTSSKLE